ncbi:conserved hypothetical protein [Culex quinquefasciatus]|uniref:Pumilio n=1 Tax=Culex quinquefasciatus TaxID=7176 RepID=B0X9P0_CULQU|nr:conserved hypothetical protein [Culex quinquefasciatus]|eukprot:XP_001866362.1 conserved hypothetical protein [Culex quinquefasciatus]
MAVHGHPRQTRTTSDDKDKANSPFESNGLKKEEVNSTNGVVIVNGIDDDKGFNRTPGSRQPSPAEEQMPRGSTLLDAPSHHGSGFPQHPSLHHMLGSAAAAAAAAAAVGAGAAGGANDVAQQAAAAALGSYHPQMINQMSQMSQLSQMNQMNQLNQMQSHVMNGVGGIPQITQSQMVSQPGQGPNQIESPANLLQQPHNFDVQPLTRAHPVLRCTLPHETSCVDAAIHNVILPQVPIVSGKSFRHRRCPCSGCL